MVAATPYTRVLQPPKGSFFLFGPRGTGKSTWLRAAFPSAHTLDLLDEALYQSFLRDPAQFGAELRALKAGSVIVVDEIQRVPSLLNEVHRHIESHGFRFALCGSSARKLKTGGTNLLAGRAVRRFMHPLLPEELGQDFDLKDVLRWGSLPVVWTAPDRSDALQSYAQLYLKEEVQAEALVRNLPGFARFLPIAALFHGQVMNTAGLARDAGVARATVQNYLSVLEDTLLTFTLPAYEARLRVRERKHPKFYWADPGLPRAMQQHLGPPAAEERGHLFEGWIACVLRAYRDYHGLFEEWFYWSPGKESSVEVDFLLRRGKEIAAIEAKSGRRLPESEFRGLRAIGALPGLKRRIVVYGGDRPMRTRDGIDILPVANFLQEVATDKIYRGA